MIKNIYFDTEFTGLHKDTTLISIGLVSDCGKTFYAELTDFDESQLDDWLYDNVIDNLLYPNTVVNSPLQDRIIEIEDAIDIIGNKEEVGRKLLEWLNQFDTVEFVSDVCHYDFVLLIDLVYSHALNMPYGEHSSSCHDINQDIAKYYNISEIEAFEKSREDILLDFGVSIEGNKHNALYDAKVIKAIYNIVN